MPILALFQVTRSTTSRPCCPTQGPTPVRRANAAWLAAQVMAYNLARWTTRIGLGEPAATTKTLRRRFFSLAGRLTRKARHLTLHLPQGWPWQNLFSSALSKLRALPLPS